MTWHTLKPETVKRLKKEYVENRQSTRLDLYKRLVVAAWNNRHNPTGQDYLTSAKRMRKELFNK